MSSEQVGLTPLGATTVAFIYVSFQDGMDIEDIAGVLDLTVEQVGTLFAIGEATGFVDELAKDINGSD